MELVVVMGVLAALAAILVPMFPNLLRRAHKVADATQTSEVSKALQLYQGAFVSYPDGFDLLTDGATTGNAGVADFLPNDGGPFGNFVTLAKLGLDESKALARVGVSNVHPFKLTLPGHPTMNPYSVQPVGALPPVALTMDKDTVVMKLNPTAIAAANPNFLQSIRSQDPTATFVVFGVGNRCTMVGQTIQDAPTSVPQNKSFTPETLYSRVGVIFMVSGAEVSRTERARFIAAGALEDDELESTEKDLVGYYNVGTTGG
jgi:hypothetical protein